MIHIFHSLRFIFAFKYANNIILSSFILPTFTFIHWNVYECVSRCRYFLILAENVERLHIKFTCNPHILRIHLISFSVLLFSISFFFFFIHILCVREWRYECAPLILVVVIAFLHFFNCFRFVCARKTYFCIVGGIKR